MWLPQGGALKIENLQFTQCSIILLLSVIVLNISAHNVDQKSLWQLHIQKTINSLQQIQTKFLQHTIVKWF